MKLAREGIGELGVSLWGEHPPPSGSMSSVSMEGGLQWSDTEKQSNISLETDSQDSQDDRVYPMDVECALCKATKKKNRVCPSENILCCC